MNENLSLKAKIYHYAVLFLVFLFLALPLMATVGGKIKCNHRKIK